MIISHRYKFVLLAPWKTASSTVHQSLAAQNESLYSRFFYFNPRLNRVVHQHITLAEFEALPESGLGYLVGAFVRNPYDRAYSGFLQLQRDVEKQPAQEYPAEWIRELVRAQLAENQKRLAEASYDFNKWILTLPDYEVFEVGRNTNMPLHPAHYWTHVGGKKRVGFIGKVETLSEDFCRFCTSVGMETPPLISENVSDPGTASNDRLLGSYKYTSRMSPDAITRINALFKEDFNLFDYRMIGVQMPRCTDSN